MSLANEVFKSFCRSIPKGIEGDMNRGVYIILLWNKQGYYLSQFRAASEATPPNGLKVEGERPMRLC